MVGYGCNLVLDIRWRARALGIGRGEREQVEPGRPCRVRNGYLTGWSTGR